MAAKAFVDTNILLRTLLPEMQHHAEADALVKQLWRETTELWISGQVVREFIVQATHPNTLQSPLTIPEVVTLIQTLPALFSIADETAVVRANLLDVIQQFPTR